MGLVIGAQVGNVDCETIGAHGRDRPYARLIAVDGRQIGKSIGADDSLQELVRTMSQHHVKRVPVIDGHRLVGIVSESDVASAAPQDLVVDLVKGVYATS